jgi:enoyl-CoA hydratase
VPNKISIEKQDHVLLIGFDRADKMNAADEELLSELALAYGELDRDPQLRVGVVFAHGDNFTAGLDLNDLGPKLAAGNLQLVPEGGVDPWGVTTRQVAKPVVMAIQGNCFTLGVELALASDIVIAADNSKFAQLEVARGIMPFGGATLRFGRVAGHANAMRYLLTADSFDAKEAYRLGLVTEVVEVGQQLERAVALAQRIAAQAPLAVQATLASARANPETEAANLMPRLGGLLQTRDVLRGLEAFQTRQPAKFEGN